MLDGLTIPFWTESEWLKAKATLPDGHTFHATYGQFVAAVSAAQAQHLAQGIPTVRVHITVAGLLAWCTSAGRQVNASARAEFATLKAIDQDSGRRAK